MLKKSLIFGSVALFLTALIALTGCSQATDSETTVTKYENYLYGTVDAVTVQTAINAAARDNRPVVLTDKLKIYDSGDGVVRFEKANVRVEGHVEVSAAGNAKLVVDASQANFIYELAGAIAVGSNSYFIYSGDEGNITSTGGVRVQYSTDMSRPPHNDADAVAVDKYTLKDTSSDTGIPNEYKEIFILDTLTIPALSQIPGRKFYMVGTAEVIGAGTSAFGDSDKLVFLPGSVLTATVSDPINIASGYSLKTIKADTDFAINVAAASAAVSISKVEGAGTLTITAANAATASLTTVAIGENAGNVSIKNLVAAGSVNVTDNDAGAVLSIDQEFTPVGSAFTGTVKSPGNQGIIKFSAPAFLSPSAVDNLNSAGTDGKVIFEDAITVGTSLTITNDVVINTSASFGGTSAVFTFGNVILGGTAKITATAAGTLTINKGKSLALGARHGILETKILEVGNGSSDAKFDLTLANGSSLAGRVVTAEELEEAVGIDDLASTLVLTTTTGYAGSLKIVGGSLQLPAGTVLSTSTGSLTLDGGALKSVGTTGGVSIGTSTFNITGVDSDIGILSSVGAVKLTGTEISGSGAVLNLGVDTEATESEYVAPLITLGSGGGKSLALIGVELNLNFTDATSGLLIKRGSSDANTVSVRPGAKIVFSTPDGAEGVPTLLVPSTIDTVLTLTSGVTNAGFQLITDAEDSIDTVYSLTPGTVNVVITGPTGSSGDDGTLYNGTSFAVAP